MHSPGDIDHAARFTVDTLDAIADPLLDVAAFRGLQRLGQICPVQLTGQPGREPNPIVRFMLLVPLHYQKVRGHPLEQFANDTHTDGAVADDDKRNGVGIDRR